MGGAAGRDVDRGWRHRGQRQQHTQQGVYGIWSPGRPIPLCEGRGKASRRARGHWRRGVASYGAKTLEESWVRGRGSEVLSRAATCRQTPYKRLSRCFAYLFSLSTVVFLPYTPPFTNPKPLRHHEVKHHHLERLATRRDAGAHSRERILPDRRLLRP